MQYDMPGTREEVLALLAQARAAEVILLGNLRAIALRIALLVGLAGLNAATAAMLIQAWQAKGGDLMLLAGVFNIVAGLVMLWQAFTGALLCLASWRTIRHTRVMCEHACRALQQWGTGS